MIKPSGKQRTQHRSQPVDPVIPCERRSSHARAEATRWVHGCAGVVDASDLDDEQREADADGRDEGVFGLLSGEHEDCED